MNENLIDLLVTPGQVGQPASIDWRPMTASYTVDNQVTTVAASQQTSLNVSEPTPGTLEVTGQIAAGSAPTLRVWEIDDPSAFARTAFIEALQRAGVNVTSPATGPNPESILPAKGSLPASDLVGEHVSAPLSQFATLIMKVSYNRGADLMVCLAAVKEGSTSCPQGLSAEVQTINRLGVPSSSAIPFDGAGSDDQGRTTPAALATFLRNATKTPFGKSSSTPSRIWARTEPWQMSRLTPRRKVGPRSRPEIESWGHRPARSSCSETAWPDTPKPRAAGRSRS